MDHYIEYTSSESSSILQQRALSSCKELVRKLVVFVSAAVVLLLCPIIGIQLVQACWQFRLSMRLALSQLSSCCETHAHPGDSNSRQPNWAASRGRTSALRAVQPEVAGSNDSGHSIGTHQRGSDYWRKLWDGNSYTWHFAFAMSLPQATTVLESDFDLVVVVMIMMSLTPVHETNNHNP